MKVRAALSCRLDSKGYEDPVECVQNDVLSATVAQKTVVDQKCLISKSVSDFEPSSLQTSSMPADLNGRRCYMTEEMEISAVGTLTNRRPEKRASIELIDQIRRSHSQSNLFSNLSNFLQSRSQTPFCGNSRAYEFLNASLRKEWGVNENSVDLTSTLLRLKEEFRSDQALGDLVDIVEVQASGDPAHDIWHVLRVAYWGVKIAPPYLSRRNIIAGSLLHDAISLPKNHPDANTSSKQSSLFAGRVLTSLKFSDETSIREICGAIEEHAFSRSLNPTSALAQVIQDADRLDALGVTGLVRLFCVGAQMGAEPFDAEDPWAERRPLRDKMFSLDHMFTKLFPVAKSMGTEQGKLEAERRLKPFHLFIDDLKMAFINIPES